MDGPIIRAGLSTRVFGRNLVLLQQTTSTNDVAMQLAAKGVPEGTVVVAEEQTAGRGRMGRRWLAPPGTSLLCSIVFRPPFGAAQANRLGMVCALAAAEAVEQVARLRVGLKWPNDLVVEEQCDPSGSGRWRKLAGLLAETGVVGERVRFVVVGLGINVNVPAEQLSGLAPDATSILAQTGHQVSRVALLAALLAGVEARYLRLLVGEVPVTEWRERMVTLGRPVTVSTHAGPLHGVAEAVDGEGALLLRSGNGTVHRLLAGDVILAH